MMTWERRTLAVVLGAVAAFVYVLWPVLRGIENERRSARARARRDAPVPATHRRLTDLWEYEL